jgi:hypothetical protein
MNNRVIIFLMILLCGAASCSKNECIQCSQITQDVYCESHFSYSAAKTAYGTWENYKQVILENKDCKIVSN